MTQKPRFPRAPYPTIETLIDYANPELYYSAQYLLQENGVILVDLETGQHISGQINTPRIGMIAKVDKQVKQGSFGFVPVPSTKQKKQKPKKPQNVDAILLCESIRVEDGHPLLLVVQVVDHRYIESWVEMLYEISSALSTKVHGKMVPQISFGVTSLCTPSEKDNNSTKNSVLRQNQGYGFDEDVYAVSHEPVPFDFYLDNGYDLV